MIAFDSNSLAARDSDTRAWTSSTEPGRRRVLFLIRSLRRGGAERQLVALASALRRSGWDVAVACFYAGGAFQDELVRAGVPVIDLHKRGRWDALGFLWRLWRTYRVRDPDIVHGYLTVGNLLALLARTAHWHTRVVWGVRSSFIDRDRYGWAFRLTFRLSCRCARMADAIIANSWAGAAHHIACGYPRERVRVVPNGIDTRRFRFDAAARKRVRAEWGVPDDALLVGMVGRLDLMKDHWTFLSAASVLAARDPRWRFVCVGGGAPCVAAALVQLAGTLRVADRVIWAGEREDMPAVYSAFDIAVSTSYGEGFPNAVAEAMACSRPCVVSDVGDSARIVGTCGDVVPARNGWAFVASIERIGKALQDLDRSVPLDVRARSRIADRYSLEALLRNSESVLRTVCGTPRHAGGG